MFRSCQIIIRELCSLLKLYYGIHNSIRICKRGVVAAYHVVWECVVEQWLGVRRMLSNKMYVLCKIIVYSLVDELKWFCENARRYSRLQYLLILQTSGLHH